jgi:hypothetical protein
MQYQNMHEGGSSKKWRLLWLLWLVVQTIAAVFTITGFFVKSSWNWVFVVAWVEEIWVFSVIHIPSKALT